MERFDLIKEFKKLDDPRRGQGRMHTIDIVLMIVILGTMSGFYGYRALGDFVNRYYSELVEFLQPKNDKLPSYSTIRRVILNVDLNSFKKIFTKWVYSYFKKENKKWVSIDGKTIKGAREEDKKLAHLVSFFISDSKEILLSKKVEDKSNEIPLVQEMIKEFELEDMILTLDAMHCQKETTKQIIQSNNDYCIQVKKNQKKII